VFLAEMAAVVPWSKLEALIEPHYPKVGPQGGRRPFPIAVITIQGYSVNFLIYNQKFKFVERPSV